MGNDGRQKRQIRDGCLLFSAKELYEQIFFGYKDFIKYPRGYFKKDITLNIPMTFFKVT